MGLTVAEKEHWKERISARIKKKIDALIATEDPGLLVRVQRKARMRACDGLGIGDEEREFLELDKEKRRIEKRQRRLRAEQIAKLRSTTPEQELETGVYLHPYDARVESDVRDRARALEDQILSESEVGRRVLTLRREQEHMLDTVWLATSCRQVRELWQKVTALLEEEPTPLEREVLTAASEPAGEQSDG
jgi:hypothetical protein